MAASNDRSLADRGPEATVGFKRECPRRRMLEA